MGFLKTGNIKLSKVTQVVFLVGSVLFWIGISDASRTIFFYPSAVCMSYCAVVMLRDARRQDATSKVDAS